MNEIEYLLTVLSEECAEVTQRASKAARFGLSEVQPGQPEDNKRRIERELGDLMATAELLGLRVYDEDKLAKLKKLKKYMEYSRDIGTLEDPSEQDHHNIEMERQQNILTNALIKSRGQVIDLATKAKAVMDDLEKHGPSIVPHLIDTDDNNGQYLRKAVKAVLGDTEKLVKPSQNPWAPNKDYPGKPALGPPALCIDHDWVTSPLVMSPFCRNCGKDKD